MAIQDIIWPGLVVFFSIFNWYLAMRQYRGKPNRIKIWLHFIFAGYAIWGLFNLILRIAPNEDFAIISLRIATVAIIGAYYGWFRFNVPFVDNEIRNSFTYYLFHLLTGANLVLAAFSNQVAVRFDPLSGYYFDDLTGDTFILLLVMAGWAGIWIFRGLRSTNFFASFYDPEARSRLLGIPIYVSLGMLVAAFVILNNVLQTTDSGAADSTGFIIFGIFVVIFLGYIYGIRPVSTVMVSQKVYDFITISPSGLPYLEVQLSKSESLIQTGLFSAGITALKHIYKSQFQYKEQTIQSLALQDRVVLISNYNNWLFCLVVEDETIQTEMLLEEITNNLKKVYEFPDEIEYSFMDNDVLYNQLYSMVNQTVRFTGGNQ